MTLSLASALTGGGLSWISKVGWSCNLSPHACKTGRLLSKQPNAICSLCYAKRGRAAIFPDIEKGRQRRTASVEHPQWTEAMITLISSKRIKYFRWHSSGDLLGQKRQKRRLPKALNPVQPEKDKAMKELTKKEGLTLSTYCPRCNSYEVETYLDYNQSAGDTRVEEATCLKCDLRYEIVFEATILRWEEL
jgi:hypothetical protein